MNTNYYLKNNESDPKLFWELELYGNCFTVTFGKMDEKGTKSTKVFKNEEEAQKEADILVQSKRSAGYKDIEKIVRLQIERLSTDELLEELKNMPSIFMDFIKSKSIDIAFNTEADAIGYYDIVEQLFENYADNQNNSIEEENTFYQLIRWSTKYLSHSVYSFKLFRFEAFMHNLLQQYATNNFSLYTPLVQDIQDLLDIVKEEIAQWVKAQDASQERKRVLTVNLCQTPLNPAELVVNKISKNLDLDMFLIAAPSHWNKAVETKIIAMFKEIIEENQTIFSEKVTVDFRVNSAYFQQSLGGYRLVTDIIKQPEYLNWIDTNVALLNARKFEELSLPKNPDEWNDTFSFLEYVDYDVVDEYLRYLGQTPNLKMAFKIEDYFKKVRKNKYCMQVADNQAAMAIFLMEDDYGRDSAVNFLKMLYVNGNKIAKDQLKDFKEWLDESYWYTKMYTWNSSRHIEQIDNKFIEKLMKDKPKAEMLYKPKTKNYDIVLAMVDESKDAYEQTLDYLLVTVPKVAKKAIKNDDFHNVMIFFTEKPNFPEVEIYKEFNNGKMNENGMPRLTELAFFYKALQWEDLHAKIEAYANLLLAEKYRYDYDESSCLAALPVVTALIMHDRKYFKYFQNYQAGNYDKVQIYIIAGIVKKYGVDEETIALIEDIANSADHWAGVDYAEQFPQLKGKLFLKRSYHGLDER